MPTLDAILGPTGADLWRRVAALVSRGADAEVPGAERDALGLELVAWQRGRCAAIDRVIRAFVGDAPLDDLSEVPGIPTDAFRTARIACFDERHTARTFLTSGTTGEVRGRHAFADLSLYRASCLATGGRWLLRDPPYRFVLLAPSEAGDPASSLGFMLARFAEAFGDGAGGDPWMVVDGRLAVDRVRATLREAARDGARVALLGPSFGFVHLLDALSPGETLRCAPGSVVLATGGFKGRSREVAPEELFAEIRARLGPSRTDVVQEYGMTELSSQAWEDHRRGLGRYVVPPWMVIRAVDPTTLAPLPPGEVGLLRVVDLTNVGSCAVVQTADLGRVHPDGSFEVHGRAPGATPRGCARALDALLS